MLLLGEPIRRIGGNGLVLNRVLHQFEGSWVPVLLPVLASVQELGPGWVTSPVLWDISNSLEQSLCCSFCLGGLVLDDVEPSLQLFPESWFALLPNGA